MTAAKDKSAPSEYDWPDPDLYDRATGGNAPAPEPTEPPAS